MDQTIQSAMRTRVIGLIVLCSFCIAPVHGTALADDQGCLVVSVLDAKTKMPIAKFSLLAGVPCDGITSEEFQLRTLQDVANFQPHTVRLGENGRYIWPLENAYDEMAIRVEADGYKPQRSGWIKKVGVLQPLIFLLEADPLIDGRILRPDGQPASGDSRGRDASSTECGH